MITFVNGFLCTCSCDVSKAKRGVDPHPQTEGVQNADKPNDTKNGVMATDKGPVVFGGALIGTSPNTAVTAAQPSGSTSFQTQGQTVDLFV